jgi:hypothetical protein
MFRRQKAIARRLVSVAPGRIVTQWRARQGASSRTDAIDTERFWFLVDLELERARRGDRSFALSTIDMRSALDSVDAAVNTLVPSMRTYDTLTEIDGVLVLMLAEADRDAAAAAVARLTNELTAVADVGEVRTVVFPDDSFSVESLLARLTDATVDLTIDPAASVLSVADQSIDAADNPSGASVPSVRRATQRSGDRVGSGT